jgi:F420-0:gamma-glutamyl ligase
LIKQEADRRIITDVVPGKDIYLTIKNNILIASAGVDESNGNGYYILWPDHLPQLSKEIHEYICQKHHVKNVGIIVTDSATRPLKW